MFLKVFFPRVIKTFYVGKDQGLGYFFNKHDFQRSDEMTENHGREFSGIFESETDIINLELNLEIMSSSHDFDGSYLSHWNLIPL